ncbi:SH3 domain-containing protein [Chryseobacterium sp. CFS15]|uniref:SH3 domain-containing protein n=1 Tax=Chryseobacterium TaxID=59732 RepID=UPI002808DC3F|nr:SH3 domain-containing protein [Chryseobacterium sp. CFS15]MDQ8142247.1 SH3 domain-containing protein [Chryseobacterium sp. CFS15]
MKKILLLFFGIILIAFTSLYFSRDENNGHKGRCTGSAYCTACSNCSRCGHCGAGGTCGVCSGGSSERNLSYSSSNKKSKTAKKSTNSTSSKKTNSKTSSTPHKLMSQLKAETIDVRKGPGFRFDVVEKIRQGTALIEIEKKDSWIKVQIQKTGTTGYIYYKDIQITKNN